jgi:acyl-CoA thioesterase FadM
VIPVFRAAWTGVKALRRPTLEPLGESTLRLRVLPNDLDYNLHVNNGRYLMLMDLGRLDLVVRLGIIGELRRRRWNPVVAAAQIRYRRSLAPFESFLLRSRIVGWDERSFWVEQRFERSGATVAHGLVRSAILGPRGRVSPADLVEALAPGVESPPLPDGVRAWRETEATLGRRAEGVSAG